MNASRPPDNESNEPVSDIPAETGNEESSEQITIKEPVKSENQSINEPVNNENNVTAEEESATRIARSWRNHR